MQRMVLAFGLALMSIAMSSSASADVLIDHFTTGSGGLTTSAASPVTIGPTNFPAAGAIGGSRTLTLSKTSGGVGQTSFISSGTETLDYSNTALSQSIASVLWDANGGGLGGLNWTALGLGYLSVNSITGDLGVVLTFTVNGTSTLSIANPVAGQTLFAFSNFSSPGVFSSVNSVQLTFTSTVDGPDFIVDFVAAVPEPSTVISSVMLLGLGGIVAYRRRKRTLVI